jgi:quercetin dioxygenase-like cupin family protein
MKSAMLLIGLLALTFFACQNPPADQQTTPASEQTEHEIATTLFENEYTRVRKITLNAGEEQPTHDGKARLVYSMNDYTISWQEGGIDKGTKVWQTGDLHFHRPGKHSARNIGNQTAMWLVFERIADDLPPCGDMDVESDIASLEEDVSGHVMENEWFKVERVSIEPGVVVPEHEGINRVIYSLSDYTIFYESDTDEGQNHTFSSGDIHWHEACNHSLKNIGETTAEFLVIAYKS